MTFLQYDHYEKTGQTIKLSDIPDTMYGGALPIPRNRKSKKRATSEVEYVDEAPEPLPKKAKKEKAYVQVNVVGPAVPSIQAEVQDLEPANILEKKGQGVANQLKLHILHLLNHLFLIIK